MSKEVKRWDELKALAEAAKAAQETHLSSDSEQAYDAWAHLDDQFSEKATPATVLDLLADYEALLAERDARLLQIDTLAEWYSNSLDVINEITAALPGAHYMDPPDGGDVSVPEQVRRMAKDAERYRWLRQRLVGASFDWDDEGMTVLAFEMPDGVSIGADCDKNIDVAMAGGRDE